MSVSTSNSTQVFTGGQSVLSFNFRALTAFPNYIQVSVVALTGGTVTALSYSTQYTVSINSSGVGGTVTISPTFGSNYNYVVSRKTAILQSSNYTDYNAFPASTLENNLDQLTMIEQEFNTNQLLTFSYPIGTSNTYSTIIPVPSIGTVLGSDPTGTFFGSIIIPSGATGAQGIPGTNGSSGSNGVGVPSGGTTGQVLTKSSGTNYDTYWAVAAGGGITSVSSSTADVTIVSTSTTPIITSVNAATSGSNKILRLDSSGKLPPLDGSNLTNLPSGSIPYVKISETQTSGTQGGTATSGSWLTRVLNTTNSDTQGISSLLSNQVTLPIGTYLVVAYAPFLGVDASQIRLQNITTTTTLITGQNVSINATNQGGCCFLSGKFVLVSASTLEVQYQVSASISTFGLGQAAGFGTSEVYTIVEFQKVS